MDIKNDFSELVGTGSVSDVGSGVTFSTLVEKTGGGQISSNQMFVTNAPHMQVAGKGINIDFHVEDWYGGRVDDYYQGAVDGQGQPVDNPNIVDSKADKDSWRGKVAMMGAKFYGEIPSKLTGKLGSGYVVSDGETHLVVVPSKEALMSHVAERGEDISKYAKLPNRWEDWANIC